MRLIFEYFRGAAYLQAAKRIKISANRTKYQIYLNISEVQPIFRACKQALKV